MIFFYCVNNIVILFIVLPENQKNVSINNITGIITVLNGLDHEEISSLTLDIQVRRNVNLISDYSNISKHTTESH